MVVMWQYVSPVSAQTSVGGVLLALRPRSCVLGHHDHSHGRSRTQAHHRQLVNDIVQNSISTQENNVVLLYGTSDSGKSFTAQLVVQELFNSLSVSEGLRRKALLAEQVFSMLTQKQGLASASLSVRNVCIDPTSAKITGLQLSMALLDTNAITEFRVFDPARVGSTLVNSVDCLVEVKKALLELGVPQKQVNDLEAIFSAITTLLLPTPSKSTVCELLGVTEDRLSSLIPGSMSFLELARLLYSYLLKEVGKL